MNKIGRNDQCPCGSGKKYKKCCMSFSSSPKSQSTWVDKEGLHVISKGSIPTEAEIDLMTKQYQEQIRNSPLWDKMVKDYGKEKAEELLKKFKAEVK
jgi:hypothetical protein